MRKNQLMICICFAFFAIYSCSKDDSELEEEINQEETTPVIPDDEGNTADGDLNTNSQNVSYDNAVLIAFSSTDVTVTNPFDNKGITVQTTNGHVVVTSSITDKEINYVLSGITPDGSVKIYGEYKFGLILNGVGITNSAGAAINIQNKKRCNITVVDKTNNRLIDGSNYVVTDGEDMKATFFTEGNIVFEGSGNLEIRGKYKHALCTDGALTFNNSTLNIKEAVSDGIHTNDEITISGGSITVRSVGDGIESESKKNPILITGGDITVVTTGEKGHGIKSKFDINIGTDGKIYVTTYGAASKGIKPSGNITISSGDISVSCAGDAIWDADEADISSAAGIKCDGNFMMEDGTLTLLSTGKGGKGISADGTLTINGGTVTATTTGDQYVYDKNNDTAAKAIKSDGNLTVNGGVIKIRTSKTEAEGLESKTTLTITGGELDIEAYDDAINASNHIQIDGGKIYCNSVTNDAIDSNGTLSITGGLIIAAGASQAEAGLDCDNSRFTITGGTIIGVGGSTSSPTASYCTQRSLIFNSSTTNIQYLRIENTSTGQEVLTIKMPKTYSQRMTMLFSSSLLAQSTGYTIYTGGSISGGSDFHGLFTDATYTKGSSAGTFTTGSAAGAVTTVGTSQGPR